MFFLLRSACCIGAIVAALPDPDHAFRRNAFVPAQVEALCRAMPDRCLDLIAAGVRTSSAQVYAAWAGRTAPRSSRDTLTEEDRRFGWQGPLSPAFD